MGWFDFVVGEAPCTRAFLLLGGGGASSAAAAVPWRSVNPQSALTCGATATKPTVSQQRPATGGTLSEAGVICEPEETSWGYSPEKSC